MLVSTVLSTLLLLGSVGAAYMGCYKDYFGNRRLLPDARQDNQTSMTNDYCQKFCTEQGFRYAGTQYEVECYCSNRRPKYKSRAPENDCHKKCRGDKEQTCGGDWRLSVYDTSESPERFDVPRNYIGCYSTKYRRVLNGFKINSDLNSPDFCIGICYHYGFRFAGVQSGNECFCGNILLDNISIHQNTLSRRTSCDTPCNVDPNTICGGSGFLGIYSTDIKQLSGRDLKSVYIGCYVDPGLFNRLMNGDRTNRPGNLTNEMCMIFCAERDFRYAGTQWKQECFCSETSPNLGNLAAEEDCSAPCDGDQNQICGGDYRLSVYDTKGKGENSVSSQYLGCFENSDQLLNGSMTEMDKLTPRLCVGFCQAKGFRLAGVQHGSQCFCDNKVDTSKTVKDSDCMYPCAGDDKLKCGGNWALSIYRSAGTQMGAAYIGCYAEESSPGTTVVPEALTPDFCIGYCLRRGFRYAATKNGQECVCGDDLTKGQNLNEDQCQTKCSGNSQHTCGGARQLSVYETAIDSGAETMCVSSITTVNGKTACSGEIVFKEEFRELDIQKWTHDLYMPSLPDYQFVVYQKDPQNIFVKTGRLYIKPTVFDDEFITAGKLSIQHCTGQLYTVECDKQAVFHSILPPIRTARINTKESFSFRYGKVEVRAKLPAGDWIVPEIWLEPKRYSRYGQHYASGRVRLAVARGNLILRSEGADIGNSLLETGVVLGVENDVATLSAQWTSIDTGGWHEKFHTFTFTWTPDDLSFSVDDATPVSILSSGRKLKDSVMFKNSNTSRAWDSGSPIAPFDQEFYITIGLSVGGLRDFPNDSVNGRSGDPKPWDNKDFKAMAKFFQATSTWKSSWTEENSVLLVESVKVTAL